MAALGFWLTSRADSVTALFLSYSLVGGMGIGLSTVLPAQTLPVFWFKRYRARATAIILLGAAVVGGLTTPVDNLILHRWDWRTGWVLIACVSVLVALISAVFLRNKPEDLGQRRDGEVDELPAPERAARAHLLLRKSGIPAHRHGAGLRGRDRLLHGARLLGP